MNFRFIIASTGLCLLLQACAKLPLLDLTQQNENWLKYSAKANAIEQWAAQGKIGVRSPTQTFTAAINSWTQNHDVYRMKLSSTFFGLGASELAGNDHFLTIYQDGEPPLSSNQPNALLEDALKLPLPIEYIKYWVRGLPAPDQQHSLELDEKGLPKTLTQYGWELSFDKFHQLEELVLPKKIKLKRKTMQITLFIGDWNL